MAVKIGLKLAQKKSKTAILFSNFPSSSRLGNFRKIAYIIQLRGGGNKFFWRINLFFGPQLLQTRYNLEITRAYLCEGILYNILLLAFFSQNFKLHQV